MDDMTKLSITIAVIAMATFTGCDLIQPAPGIPRFGGTDTEPTVVTTEPLPLSKTTPPGTAPPQTKPPTTEPPPPSKTTPDTTPPSKG